MFKHYKITETVSYEGVKFEVRIDVYPLERSFDPISIQHDGIDFEPLLRDGICNVLYSEAWSQYCDADGANAFDFYKDDTSCTD
jgi:hypothetical protein